MRTFTEVCEACSGTGRSKYVIYTSSTSNPDSQPMNIEPLPCPNCHGTGTYIYHVWELEDFEAVRRLLDKDEQDESA